MNTRAEGILSRPFGRLLVFVWAALLLGAVGAKASPVKTVVRDTLYRADGQVAQGMLTIRWNAFSTGAGEAVPAGEMTASIGADGTIAIPLIPNTGSLPSGGYYKVVFKLNDGTASEEQWVVPAAATTTVAAVRAKVVPQAVAAQFVGRDYVDTALAAVLPASLLHVAGAETITGAKTFTISPEVPVVPADAGAAVARAYMDQQFGGLATVATTGNYNDLVNKPTGGANLSSPGAIGSSTPGTVNATAYSVNGAPISSANLSDGSTLAKTNQANTFSQPQTMSDVLTNVTPVVDIRAYGAVIDGATDIGSALASATAQACTTSGVVYLPCAGSGCYLANGAALPNSSNGTSCATNGIGVQYKIQGTLKVGTTLVAPNNSSFVCDGGGGPGQFTPKGPNCTIQGPAVYGSLGTPISAGSATFTPTFTGGTIASLPVGSAITVAGNTTCNISTISRTSAANNNVTATLSSPQCRIPAGTVITVAGVTDSSYNTTPMLLSSDFVGGAMTWTQSGTAGSSSGGTVTGLNDDTFETVTITAVSGATATATFAHAHDSTDSFGAVAVEAKPDSFTAHYFQGVSVSNNYGAGFWFPHNAEVLLDGVAAGEKAYITSIPIEMASSFGWHITNSSFVTTTSHFCGTSCGQQGYPAGLRITSLSGKTDPSDLNMMVDGNTFITGGIKVDINGLSGSLAKIGGLTLSNITIEQPTGNGLIIDPRGVGGTNRLFTLNNVMLQDNFWSYPQCLVGYTDPATNLGSSGSVAFNSLNATLLSGCIINQNYNGAVLVNGLDYAQGTLPLPRYLATVGTLNDGVTTETEFRGEGADMGPSLIPYATENVTTDPTAWSCSGTGCAVNTGLEAPDGTATAGEIVAGSAINPYATVLSFSTATSAGDWIISGVWCMAGTNSTSACRSSNQLGTPYYIYSYGAGEQFDNTSSSTAYPTVFQSSYTSDWWHPIVSANKVTAGVASSHNLQFRLYGPSTTGAGTRYWQPFFIYIPISAKPASMTTAQWDAEIARWRQWLLHGHVSPNMPAGVLDIAKALKLYWGSDTNLYRGAAGVVKTDGSFNAVSGYQVNGSALGFSNLAGSATPAQLPAPTASTIGGVESKDCSSLGSNYVLQKINSDGTETCVAAATTYTLPAASAGALGGVNSHTCATNYFVSSLNTDGTETCATLSGAGTGNVIGPGSSTAGHLASFTDTTGQLIQDTGIASSAVLTTAGGQTIGSAETVSGLTSGCVQLPCVVAKVAPGTTGIQISGTTIFTPGAAGQFRLCGYEDVVTAGSAGSLTMGINYTSDGHAFSPNVNSSAFSVTTQWATNQGCYNFYSDAHAIQYFIAASGLTGSPSVRYSVTLEQLQ